MFCLLFLAVGLGTTSTGSLLSFGAFRTVFTSGALLWVRMPSPADSGPLQRLILR